MCSIKSMGFTRLGTVKVNRDTHVHGPDFYASALKGGGDVVSRLFAVHVHLSVSTPQILLILRFKVDRGGIGAGRETSCMWMLPSCARSAMIN